MSSLLPLASFNLKLTPFSPQPCQTDDFPITVRLTLASIDPEATDDKNEPSTLRILKKTAIFADGDDDDDDEDEDEDEDDHDTDEEDVEEEDEEAEKEEKKSKEVEEDEDDDSEDEDDEDEDDEGVEEHIICTLSPTTQFQQSLDLTILPDEEVFFVVTGSYTVHLTGNYVDHPNDEDEDDYVYGTDEEDDYDDDEYDLTPDEDEIIDEIEYDLDELDKIEDIEGKIEELVEEDEKNSKKRQAEEEEESESKKAKKDKKAKKEKTVKFNKELEQGPTGPAAEKEAPKAAKKEQKKDEKKDEKKVEKKVEKKEQKKEQKKPAVKTLPGGVIIEDKTVGTGPVCKKGQKVGVRYIGKLKNGKVFDKNTSGKPFHFGLGKGEVIKGWDVGVAGMAVGGERRVVIPAPMAYGSQKLPGIPANSELTFDVKLLSIK
ncbi:peptidylprolyl isomerase fpr4 [Pichia californica]|uniref:FK506-binding protein n=1 Tax=Pichia californica TaxID=460514 RepID=A0A9P6WPT2_9ASCO|nr:peptidylprolyl isomerase fpr4 [[Candida] californica]